MNLAKDVMQNPTAYSDADFANMGPLGPTMKRLVTIKTKGCGSAPVIAAQKAWNNTGALIGDFLQTRCTEFHSISWIFIAVMI
jgi:hypothetical protein